MTIQDLQIQAKIAQYRKKWVEAKSKEDTAMMSVIERCVKALKIGAKLEK